jgi:threonine dehydrogenase-like Zn-dependent dehydrogenase
LIGIVCVSRGHKTFITDIDQTRLDVAKSHGMIPVAPDQVEAAAREATNGLGTDVVFEVSGSAGGATLISSIVKPRGKIIVVGIHAELRQFNLQQIFHKEVTMQGARVYKSIDFDDAIEFLATRSKELEPLITKVFPVEDALEAYLSLTRGGSIKNLIAISEPAI